MSHRTAVMICKSRALHKMSCWRYKLPVSSFRPDLTHCASTWLRASRKIRTCEGHFPCSVSQGYIEEPGNSAAVLGSWWGIAVRYVTFCYGWELVGVPWKPVVTGCCCGQLCLNVPGEGKPPFPYGGLIWGGKLFRRGRARVTFSDLILLSEPQRSSESYKPAAASQSCGRVRCPYQPEE